MGGSDDEVGTGGINSMLGRVQHSKMEMGAKAKMKGNGRAKSKRGMCKSKRGMCKGMKEQKRRA